MTTGRLRGIDDGQTVLEAYVVGNAAYGLVRPLEIPELPRTRQIGGIEHDMVMHMGLVYVRGDDEGVVALREPQGEFPPNLVGFFRGDLPGLERLPDVVT